MATAALRYGGLAGALLLAVAGARSGQRWIALPTWLAGTVLLTGAWLVLGRRLSGVGLRWLLVTGALWALPVLVSLPLASRDVYAYACQGSLVTHGMDPYANGAANLPCPWLSTVPRMWRFTPSPYGPLWLVISGAAAASRNIVVAVGLFKLVALAGMALVGWAGHRLARALGTDPVRAAWLGLLSPLVLVHALSGAHNDALLAGLILAAVAAAVTLPPTATRPLVAGALLGLAVAVKATALVVLPFLALLLVADRRWWPVIRAAAVASLGIVGAYGVLWALTGYGLGWLSALSNTARLVVEWTSIPTGVGMGAARALSLAGQPGLAHHAVAAFRLLGLVALAAVLVGLWWWARGRTRPDHVVVAVGLALLAVVLLAPVAFPWYALAPLAVLAYGLTDDRRRYLVGLLVTPAMLLILPSGNGLATLSKAPGYVIDGLLVLGAVALAVRYLLRRRSRPTREPELAGQP